MNSGTGIFRKCHNPALFFQYLRDFSCKRPNFFASNSSPPVGWIATVESKPVASLRLQDNKLHFRSERDKKNLVPQLFPPAGVLDAVSCAFGSFASNLFDKGGLKTEDKTSLYCVPWARLLRLISWKLFPENFPQCGIRLKFELSIEIL